MYTSVRWIFMWKTKIAGIHTTYSRECVLGYHKHTILNLTNDGVDILGDQDNTCDVYCEETSQYQYQLSDHVIHTKTNKRKDGSAWAVLWLWWRSSKILFYSCFLTCKKKSINWIYSTNCVVTELTGNFTLVVVGAIEIPNLSSY